MKALALGAVVFGLATLAPAQKTFKGRLSAKPAAFNAFIARNDGKTVRLDVTFDPEGTNTPGKVTPPYAYKATTFLAYFFVGDRDYFASGTREDQRWEDVLNWDPATRRLRGTFRVKKNRRMKDGKTFDLTFVSRR